MRKLLLIALVALIPASPVRPEPDARHSAATREAKASPAPSQAIGDKLTVREALNLETAIRNLDGHLQVIKQNGTEGTVMVPWDFGSGSLRIRLANNLAILIQVEMSADNARKSIIREIVKDKPGQSTIEPGTPQMDDYMRQYNEMLDQPASGTQDLSRIKLGELRLDQNEIPVTVLAALKPILEQ